MSKKERSTFTLEGRFLGFAAKEGYKLKYARLMTASGEQVVKLPKELRSTLYRTLTPGEWVQVSGEQKQELYRDRVKLKANTIAPVSPRPDAIGEPSSPLQSPVAKPSDCILVCQKSDCCKRGGKALAIALESAIEERGLSEQVRVKGTGCMKRCKAGPNLVMPDKTRYTQIQARSVPELLDKHFPETSVQPRAKEKESALVQ